MKNLCRNCKHYYPYKPIGGFLPSMYQGMGSCYPEGTKGKEKDCITSDHSGCKNGKFERKET